MKILFVCEGNMMRSQIAELFYNSMTNSTDAISAGAVATLNKTISKRAVEVMSDVGVDATHQHSKQLTPQMMEYVDKVILFPSDYMPEYATANDKAEIWDVADPHYNKEEGMDFVRQVRDDIRARVTKLIEGSVQ